MEKKVGRNGQSGKANMKNGESGIEMHCSKTGGDMRRILTVAEFRELCLKEPYPYVGLITHDLALRERDKELLETLEECSFRLAALVAASGDFSDANAKALDKSQAVIANARGEVCK
jgi:hypothetical protein